MPIVSPTVLAQTEQQYAEQIKRITPFSQRIQIDLMDGDFAAPASVELDDVWWPKTLSADIHLMYRHPMEYLQKLIRLQPNMVIIHAEAELHRMNFAAHLHKEGIKAGLAILPETTVASVEDILHSFDHLLIFSGHLGHFGGEADLSLVQKAQEAKSHHPDLEIGWDGGVNAENAKQLIEGGVDVLNAGGFIQKSKDPEESYKLLLGAL